MQNKRDTSFNFVMFNGDSTQYPCVDIKLEETKIPDGSEIRRVRLREYNDIEANKSSPLVQDKVSPRMV